MSKKKLNRCLMLSAMAILTVACGNGGSTDELPEGLSPELVKKGERLYVSLTCNSCHTNDGRRFLAPTFKGLYGKEEQLQDGTTVIVDDAYIRESILDPNAKIVAGYQPMHPPFQQQITEEQIRALTEYIKSLQ